MVWRKISRWSSGRDQERVGIFPRRGTFSSVLRRVTWDSLVEPSLERFLAEKHPPALGRVIEVELRPREPGAITDVPFVRMDVALRMPVEEVAQERAARAWRLRDQRDGLVDGDLSPADRLDELVEVPFGCPERIVLLVRLAPS